MVAKVTPPRKKPFYVWKDQEINEALGVSRLSNEFRNSLTGMAILGTEPGFRIVSLGERGDASIMVTKEEITFKGGDEAGWVGMEFARNPSSVVFVEEGTLLEPMTEKEMDAEIVSQQKSLRKEE